MVASLLAFSLAIDSTKARYREKKRYWRVNEEKRLSQSMVKVGRVRDGHFFSDKFLIHSGSKGSRYTIFGRKDVPSAGLL